MRRKQGKKLSNEENCHVAVSLVTESHVLADLSWLQIAVSLL